MPFDPHGGGGGKFDDGGGGHGQSHAMVRDEASCILQQASSGGDSGSTLKAHDYIGLSEVSSMPASKASASAAVPDLNLGETELRLGPPKSVACKVQAESPAPVSAPKDKSAPPTHWQAHRNMEAAPTAPAPAQPQPQDMSAPKSGAKRGFSEAIGNAFLEGRSVMPSIGAPAAPGAPKSTNPLMPYPWNSASAKLPAAWRMGLEQSKGGFGPFPSASRPKIDGNDNRSSWDNSASASPASTKMSNGSSSGMSQQQEQQTNKDDSSDEVAPASSPPVVGWPPVQSFRKNTLASHPPPPAPSQQKSSADSKASTAAVAAAAANVAAPPAPAPAAAGGSSPPLLVKVYMDGVPIGRKVDLKSHNSYDKLSTVLEEMFQRFVSGEISASREADQHKKLNFLHGSEFVLTYEDKEGDLMLVGDVPWGMFTGTVKRLRIMKGSEAIGLAPRTAGDNKAAAQ